MGNGNAKIKPPLCHLEHVQDIFATDLAHVETVGGCCRLVFAVEQLSPGASPEQERVVVAKIVLPAAEAEALVRRLLAGDRLDHSDVETPDTGSIKLISRP